MWGPQRRAAVVAVAVARRHQQGQRPVVPTSTATAARRPLPAITHPGTQLRSINRDTTSPGLRTTSGVRPRAHTTKAATAAAATHSSQSRHPKGLAPFAQPSPPCPCQGQALVTSSWQPSRKRGSWGGSGPRCSSCCGRLHCPSWFSARPARRRQGLCSAGRVACAAHPGTERARERGVLRSGARPGGALHDRD